VLQQGARLTHHIAKLESNLFEIWVDPLSNLGIESAKQLVGSQAILRLNFKDNRFYIGTPDLSASAFGLLQFCLSR
jgi:hypothetical protein